MVLIFFLINTILFQMVVHNHVSQKEQQMSSERKEEVRSLRTSIEKRSKKVVPSSQVLDKFIVQERLIEDRSSSDISMGTEALDRFMLLWRGIAALEAFPEYQSDPEKSWRLIEEELKMLEQMGVNVLNPIAQLRSGVMDVDVLMKSVPRRIETLRSLSSLFYLVQFKSQNRLSMMRSRKSIRSSISIL